MQILILFLLVNIKILLIMLIRKILFIQILIKILFSLASHASLNPFFFVFSFFFIKKSGCNESLKIEIFFREFYFF